MVFHFPLRSKSEFRELIYKCVVLVWANIVNLLLIGCIFFYVAAWGAAHCVVFHLIENTYKKLKRKEEATEEDHVNTSEDISW
jgi:type III secretory pathway component EscU